jgi:hypothetical protein
VFFLSKRHCIIYSYFFGLSPFNHGIVIGYPAIYYQFYIEKQNLQHGFIGGINFVYNFLIVLGIYLLIYVVLKKNKMVFHSKIFCFLFLILIISCENKNYDEIYLDFNNKYFDLLKDIKIDSSKHNYKCKTTIENQDYYFDVLVSKKNENIIFDNVMDINIRNKDVLLINNELIHINNYDIKIKKIFDRNLKTRNENLNIMFFYDDNTTNDNKNKVIKSVFRYINFKNDSISIEKFKRKYNLLNAKEVEKIKLIFRPMFLFSNNKHEIPPQPF